MKTSKKWLGLILLVIIVFVVISIVRGYAPKGGNTINVGVIAPLSGQYGTLGESFLNAVRMNAEKDPRIKLFVEDSKFDPKIGLSAFHKLVDINHIDVLINLDSLTLEAITPLVNESHLPVIQIFESQTHEKDSIFQMLPFSYPLFTDLGAFASEKYPKITVVYSNISDLYTTDVNYFKKGLKNGALGEVKIGNGSYIRSDVTKMLSDNPDAFALIVPSTDGIKFLKEFVAQKGTRKASLICDANIEIDLAKYVEALGPGVFEGCISTNLPNTMTDSFISEYKSKFGSSEPMIGADWGYDSITIVKNLLDVPKNKWVDSIARSSFEGASGHVGFDETGTRFAVSERHIFRNGTFVRFENSAVKNQQVTIGVILPLTGQYSVIGETVKNGMEMSLKALPADDQKNIKLIFEDDKYTTKDALSAYQKLTSLNHADIIVSISSPTVEITKPEVNKAGQLMFILGDELSHDKDRVFELMPQGAGLFKSLAVEAAKHYKSISIIYASDNNLFKTNSDLFKAAAPASLNVHLVPVQGNSDIRTEVSQVAKSGDEAFAVFVPLETGVKILNEMKKYPATSKPHLLCDANLALTVSQYISAVGADPFEGCISTVLADTKAPAFVSAYKSAYSSDPQFGSDYGYDAVQIIEKLIKKGGKDSWVSTLNDNFTYSGYSGSISLDETGTRAAFTDTQIFKGGKFVKLGE